MTEIDTSESKAIEPLNAEENESNVVYRLRKTQDWFVKIIKNDGTEQYYGKEGLKTKLKKKIIYGEYEKNNKIEIHAKNNDGKWQKSESTLYALAKENFQLRILYQPIWGHTMEGLKWGILSGIGIKLLDTTILLATVDPGMALGGIIGLVRKRTLKLAIDQDIEPQYIIVKAILVPLLMGCTLMGLYLFVFNPLLVKFLEQ